MSKKIKLCFMALVLILADKQSAQAQTVYAWTMANGAKSIEVLMDQNRENGLWVHVGETRIVFKLNQQYHSVSIDGSVNNRLRIVDGDHDSAILIGGVTPPADLNIWIWGNGGDDWIHNQIGQQDNHFGGSFIYGGDGDDEIWSGPGPDLVYGGDGDDTIYGGTGLDWIEGESGNDLLFGEEGDDHLFGGAGYDEVDGGIGADYLYGNDRLPDRDGVSDLLIGGPGATPFTARSFDGRVLDV